jgi:hypothetical protein
LKERLQPFEAPEVDELVARTGDLIKYDSYVTKSSLYSTPRLLERIALRREIDVHLFKLQYPDHYEAKFSDRIADWSKDNQDTLAAAIKRLDEQILELQFEILKPMLEQLENVQNTPDGIKGQGVIGGIRQTINVYERGDIIAISLVSEDETQYSITVDISDDVEGYVFFLLA